MKRKSKMKSSDSVNSKQTPKKLNPFEVHINRRKFDVLGMKPKFDRGLPGVSRSKAMKKRKATLLHEYKFKDKKNTFMDRRIGENNKDMTAEDKLIARYTAERVKFHSKKSLYNLGDDEELTHKGQSLTDIEKFDDPKSDDEFDETEDGKLDSNFVEDAHFGGGMFKKVEGESKSRKDLIDELIFESKKRKAEKQKLREETLDLTQKLDTEWKELLPLVAASKKSKMDAEQDYLKDEKSKTYDIISKELKFEARGKPTDRLKSEEEIAKEEEERLKILEKDRIERMLGTINSENKKPPKHKSADDLDDGFEIEEGDELFLKYNKDGIASGGNFVIDKNNDSDNSGEVSQESEEEESDDNIEDEHEENEDEETEENFNNDIDDEDSVVDISDLKHSDGSDIEEENSLASFKASNIENFQIKNILEKEKSMLGVKSYVDVSNKMKEMEKARNELPYAFEVPDNYEDFENLMKDYNADYQAVILERMIKCNHPKLKEEYKEKLETLYTFLLQHLQDTSTDQKLQKQCFKVLDRLAPWLYDLTQWSPENSTSNLCEVIKEKFSEFKRKKSVYPSLDTLIFFELVSILFPTSDYRHRVTTPCLVFMEHILANCRVLSSMDVSAGLLVSTLVLEYCCYSKRFVPEVINFIRGLLRLALPKKFNIPTIPPFKLQDFESFNLQISDKSKSGEPSKMTVEDLLEKNNDDEFKIRALFLSLNLLDEFCDFWGGEPAAFLIFEPFIPLLDDKNYSDNLKSKVNDILTKIKGLQKCKLQKLVLEKKKPKPLKLYEPKIEEVYSLKQRRPMSREKQEREKLVHKYKKELKGALREIRRDRSFVSKLKFKEMKKSDMERQRKVKEILGSAAEQAGELRKIKKKK